MWYLHDDNALYIWTFSKENLIRFDSTLPLSQKTLTMTFLAKHNDRGATKTCLSPSLKPRGQNVNADMKESNHPFLDRPPLVKIVYSYITASRQDTMASHIIYDRQSIQGPNPKVDATMKDNTDLNRKAAFYVTLRQL